MYGKKVRGELNDSVNNIVTYCRLACIGVLLHVVCSNRNAEVYYDGHATSS